MKSFSNSDQSRLGSYLLGGLGIATSIATQQADAAVTAFTFSPSVITTTTGVSFHNNAPLGGVTTDARNNYIEIGGAYHNSSGGTYRGLVQFFAPSSVIGTGGNGDRGAAKFFDSETAAFDFTTDQAGFIGFRTNSNNFGYADVSWNEASKTLTINSAFVESVAGAPITVVPEPSVAGLLALGAVAAARSRRREKNAA